MHDTDAMRIRNPFAKAKRDRAGALRGAAWVIVGLGNPGASYANTRHNVGFWVVSELAKRAGVQMKAGSATMQAGLGELAGTRVALVRPKTYVNQSGRAVRQAMQAAGVDAAHTVVVYDDLDLPLGALRIRAGGGTGGHNGLKSIVASVGGDFIRVRVGIGRPLVDGKPARDPDTVADFVLSEPTGAEREELREMASRAADAIEAIVAEGVDVAGTRFNRR
ncbi:MAG: aminoacyl-tRNA hydrolase [Dehalococcoidia bacterium]